MKATAKSAARDSTLGVFLSVPWCCVVPAVFSLLSLTGVAFARVWLGDLHWFLLPLAAVMLGRALWLVHVKHLGARWTRWVTWGATALSVALWTPRLLGMLRF